MLQSKRVLTVWVSCSMLLFLACDSSKGDNKKNEEELSPTTLTDDDQKENEAGSLQHEVESPTPASETKPAEDEQVLSPDQALTSSGGIFAVNAVWLKGPVTGYENDVELTFARSDLTKATRVELVRFRTWMEVHGHGGDDRKVKIERDSQRPYVFRISNFYPIMAGPWSLRITAAIDGIEDQVDIGFKI